MIPFFPAMAGQPFQTASRVPPLQSNQPRYPTHHDRPHSFHPHRLRLGIGQRSGTGARPARAGVPAKIRPAPFRPQQPRFVRPRRRQPAAGHHQLVRRRRAAVQCRQLFRRPPRPRQPAGTLLRVRLGRYFVSRLLRLQQIPCCRTCGETGAGAYRSRRS